MTAGNENQYYDKDWMACDNSLTSPYYGNCYLQWDDYGRSGLIRMTTSSNGGQSWSKLVSTTGSNSCLGGQILVTPTGTVVVAAAGYTSDSILSFRSTTGGATWTDFMTASSVQFHPVSGSLRAEYLPSAEINGEGKVYVVWSDCRFRSSCARGHDLVYMTTLDGLTWSSVTRIPINPVTSAFDHFITGVGINKRTSGATTAIAVTYYYYENYNCGSVCGLNAGFISSNNSGVTWSSPVKLAGPLLTTWLPLTTLGYMVGDYMSTSFADNGKAIPIFISASAKSGSTYSTFLSTIQGGISV